MTTPENTTNASPATTGHEEILWGCFCGLRGLEIGMTLEQALGASHQGSCDEDVAALVREPAIAAQLDALGADSIRAALRDYGAWDDWELADDAANRERAVWCAACAIREDSAEGQRASGRADYLSEK